MSLDLVHQLKQMGVKRAKLDHESVTEVEFFNPAEAESARAATAQAEQIDRALASVERDYKQEIIDQFEGEDKKAAAAKLKDRDEYWSS